MLSYNTHQKNYSPSFEPFPQGSPYRLPGAHADVYAALSAKNSADIEASRDRAETEFANQRSSAARASTLAGLQNMQRARQQQLELQNRRLGLRTGLASSVLSGLFR